MMKRRMRQMTNSKLEIYREKFQELVEQNKQYENKIIELNVEINRNRNQLKQDLPHFLESNDTLSENEKELFEKLLETTETLNSNKIDEIKEYIDDLKTAEEWLESKCRQLEEQIENELGIVIDESNELDSDTPTLAELIDI